MPLVDYIRPGPKGQIGDPRSRPLLVQDDQKDPQYVPLPNYRQLNLQDGSYTRINDVVTQGGPGRVEYLSWGGNRSMQSRYGWVLPSNPEARHLIPIEPHQGPISWNMKVAGTNNALTPSNIFPPPAYAPREGQLLRGNNYPIIRSNEKSDLEKGNIRVSGRR